MTSQLILMNGFGVAVASDSVVTFGGTSRTYDTAEKVIPLATPHRLAVLHSGSVRLHGLPYSVLVAEWVSSLGETPLRSVDQYRASFISWLESNHQWFSSEVEFGDFLDQLEDAYRAIRNEMLDAAKQENLEPVESRVLAVVESRRDWLSRFEPFAAATESWVDATWSTRESIIKERFEYWFDDVVRTPAIDQAILEYSRLYVQRGQFLNRATLAFVGYGREEILPAFANVEVVSFLEGELMFELVDSQSGNPERVPYFGILPLGQSSAIDLFLRGVAHGSLNVAMRASSRVLNELRSGVKELIDDEEVWSRVDDAIETGTQEVFDAISDDVWDYSDREFVHPLRGAIAGLPAADLAAVAKSLVELQALRQTTTAELGTVGGPIDVATISRDRGFEWVRHKSMDIKF
jgi:hypothetical protein